MFISLHQIQRNLIKPHKKLTLYILNLTTNMNFTSVNTKFSAAFAALLVALLVSSSVVAAPAPCDWEECNGSCAGEECT